LYLSKLGKYVGLALVLSLLLFAAIGCGPEEAEDPDPDPDPVDPDEPADEKGGVLRVGMTSDVSDLDPAQIGDVPSSRTGGQIYDTLVTRDVDGNHIPSLAEDWEANEDATVWTFYLRDDVYFHDGSHFDAEVVEWHFNRMLDPEVGALHQGDFDGTIDEVYATDDYTVVFELHEPEAPFLDTTIIHNGGYIPSKEAVEEKGDDFSTNPVGTGPFEWDEWVAGQEVRLTRNDDYFEGAPKLDGVEFVVIPEEATMIMELEMGGIHISTDIAAHDIDRIDEDPEIDLNMTKDTSIQKIAFNHAEEPFNNMELRQALAKAVDYEDVVRSIEGDTVSFGDSIIPQASWAYPDDPHVWEHDVDAAYDLFEKAGYTLNDDDELVDEDGEQLSFNLLASDSRSDLAEVLQEEFRLLGIDVTADVLEFGAYLDQMYEGDFEMVARGWRQSAPEPANFTDTLIRTGGRGNYGEYSNPEADELFAEARATSDIEKRRELYEKAEHIYDPEVPYIYTHESKYIGGIRQEVEGYEFTPFTIDYTETYIDE